MANNGGQIRKTVLLTAKPDLHDDMRLALIKLQEATRTEPDCRFFTFYQALEDRNAFVLVEDFASAGALEHHMQQPYTRAFFAAALVAQSKVFLESDTP